MVSPGQFIPIAEDTGLIVPLGQKIMIDACKQLADFHDLIDSGVRRLSMSINFSARQMGDVRCVERVRNALTRTGVDPETIKLEITETATAGGLSEMRERLDGLKALGVGLSIDDFGTGYSSLSYLHALPFDTLKIDQAFVRSMHTGEENIELVRTIHTIADTFDMGTVAEGVEDEDVLEMLRGIGVGLAQGYYFAKPMAAEEIIAKYGRGSTAD